MDNYSVHWFSDHNCEGCGLTFQDQTFLNKHKERKTCSESAKKAKNDFYEVQASEQEANQNKGYNCVYGGISCKGFKAKKTEEMAKHVSEHHPLDIQNDVLKCPRTGCEEKHNSKKSLDAHVFFSHSVQRYVKMPKILQWPKIKALMKIHIFFQVHL